MKEFKDLEDEKVEKKFDEDLKEIKNKLNAEKLSDEFKEKLQAKLEDELNKTSENNKGKIIKFPVITRKLAGICACFVLFCSSCFAFADEIENAIFSIFGDTDKIIENAIANGNYKEIDMEYVENNGISVKVDYVVLEEDNLYIAFDVLGEESDKIFFKNISIRDQNDWLLYIENGKQGNSKLTLDDDRIDSTKSIVIYKLTEIQYDVEEISKLKFEINTIGILKDNFNTDKNGIWKFEIDI